MQFTASRILFATVFILCALAMALALYLELHLNLMPCPLCIMQRLVVIALGLVSFVGFIHHPKNWGIRVYSGILVLICVLGLCFSLRQVWLQSLPPGTAPTCGVGLNTMIEMFPLKKVIMMLFEGTGECALVHLRFLGLSIAGWTSIFFIFIMLANLVQFFQKINKRSSEF